MASSLTSSACRAMRSSALRQLQLSPQRLHPNPYPCSASTSSSGLLRQPCRSFHESSPRSHDTFQASLQANKIWASDIAAKDPEFFKNSAKGQTPEILWIGCCDSRVPETTVLNKKPGEVFVLRNIANVINSTDVALLSAVEFSVKHLKIKHIVLCGHTSCGGVKATLANNKLDILDVWLQPMRHIREKHADALGKLSAEDKEDALAKLNVQAGVDNLRRIPTVVDAIRDRGLKIHGLLYRLDSGHLEQVDTAEDDKTSACRNTTFELK